MGSTYANVTLLTGDIDAVVAEIARAEERAYILSDGRRVVVAVPEDTGLSHLRAATAHLSKYLKCTALGVSVYDDDVLMYEFAVHGGIIDSHVSGPDDLFEGGPRPPAGNAGLLLKFLRAKTQPEDIEPLLAHMPPADAVDPNIWRIASLRHKALAEKLGLPGWAAGFGFSYAGNSEFPQGVDIASLRTLGIN